MGTSQPYRSNNQNPIEAIMVYQKQGIDSLSKSLAIFLSNIKICGVIMKPYHDKELWVTEDIIDLFLHPKFSEKCTFFVNLLVNELQEFFSRKMKVLVKKDVWNFYFYLTQFLMLCFDAKILDYVNDNQEKFNLVTSVDEKIIQKNQEQFSGIDEGGIEAKFVKGNPSNRMEQLGKINQILFQFMYYCIHLKNRTISRLSSFTLENAIVYNLLALSSKTAMFFCKNLENKIRVLSYCLGFGIEHSNSSMINMSLKLIQVLVLKYIKQFKQIQSKPIPSHYFQTLPVICCKNIYESIATYCLYIYGFKSQGVNMKLLRGLFLFVFKQFKPNNKEILYYLDMISGIPQLTIKKREGVYQLLKGYINCGGPISDRIKKFMLEYKRDCYQAMSRSQMKEVKKKDLIISNFEDKNELQQYYHKMCVYKLMKKQLDTGIQTKNNQIIKQFEIIEKLQKQKQYECSTYYEMKQNR